MTEKEGFEEFWKAQTLKGDPARNHRIVREAYAAGWQAGSDKIKHLASGMRKVLPPELLRELIDRCDPLSAFLRELR